MPPKKDESKPKGRAAKKPPKLEKPPKPTKIDKSFMRNKSSDVIPADPPRHGYWTGNGMDRPYDYLAGMTQIGPKVSVLPPAYMAGYASLLANRAQVLSSFEIEQDRAMREAAFISKKLDALQGGPTYKGVQFSANLPKGGVIPEGWDDYEETEDEPESVVMEDAFSESSLPRTMSDMRSVPPTPVAPEETMEDVEEDISLPMPPRVKTKTKTDTQHESNMADVGTRESLVDTQHESNIADAETQHEQQEIQHTDSNISSLFDETLEEMEAELESINEYARGVKRRGDVNDETRRVRPKNVTDDVWTPSPAELNHVFAAIRSSSSYHDAQQVLHDFLDSYKEQGIEVSIPLETMAALSYEVSVHTVRENINRLESELSGALSAERRRQLERELRSYRRIFQQ